jgi:hypothetical protein
MNIGQIQERVHYLRVLKTLLLNTGDNRMIYIFLSGED